MMRIPKAAENSYVLHCRRCRASVAAFLFGILVLQGCSGQTQSVDDCGNGVVDPGEACDDGNDADWDGCSDCAISEFTIPAEASSCPNVDVDQEGNVVVVWGAGSIRGQRMLADGTATAPFYGADPTEGDRGGPAVATARDGAFVLLWRSWPFDQPATLEGRLFYRQGTPKGPVFDVYEYQPDEYPGSYTAAMAGDGRFAGVWIAGDRIHLQRFNAFGSVDGTTFVVENLPESFPTRASAAMADDGSLSMVWDQVSHGMEHVYLQRFLSDGHPIGPPIELAADPFGMRSPDLSTAPDGSFAVVWEGSYGQSGWHLFLNFFGPDGAVLGEERMPADVYASLYAHPSVALAENGDSVVVWNRFDCLMRYCTTEIRAQRFAENGAPYEAEFRVNTDLELAGETNPYPKCARVASAPDGRFAVTWLTYPEPGVAAAFVQRFDSDGRPRGLLPW